MPSVLSSRKLSASQANLLLNAGISYVEYEAIQIEFLDVVFPDRVENAIVTSQHTVQVLVQNEVEIDRCFCVGEKTAARLRDHGYFVEVMRHYGKDLADLIVQKYTPQSFTLFCGNKRRHEIPETLHQHQFALKEVEVYQNKLNPVRFERNFDGILFFSPSQIQSYTRLNRLGNQIAFCIGTTTAAEARKHTQTIVTAHKPTVENVLVQVINTLKPKT